MAVAESEFSWFIAEGEGKSERGIRRFALLFCVHRTGPRVRHLDLGPTWVKPDDLPMGLGRFVPSWLPILSPLRVAIDDRPLVMAALYDLDSPERQPRLIELEVEHGAFDPKTFSAASDQGELVVEAFLAEERAAELPQALQTFYAAGGFAVALAAHGPDFDIELHLRQAKPPVVYGDDGSPRLRHGSVETSYFQRSRMEVVGALELRADGRRETITHFVGDASHDRQWLEVTSPQLKWMWPHLRLDDGTELMGYVLRDSSAGRWASPDDGREIGRAGWLVDVDGSTRRLPSFDIRSVPAFEVRSDRGLVPTRFEISVSELDLKLVIEHTIKAPYLPMKAFGAMIDAGAWEGPAHVVSASRPIRGHCWVEVVNAATARLGTPTR